MGLLWPPVTRHSLRREPLVRPGRTIASAALIIAGLGIALARPADSPGPTVGRANEVPGAAATTAVHSPSATPPQLAMPAPDPSPSAAPTSAPRAAPDRRIEVEDEVTRLTNAKRVAAGCAPVRTDERLRSAARGHSEDMAARQYFAHSSPDGQTPWDRAVAAGYDAPSAENIAQGFPDPQTVVEAWMDSPGHRANILSCESRATGVGVEVDGAGAPYWTQMFGYE